MPAWTHEKTIQLLLLVIRTHVKVTPDYDLLAAHWGVTREAVRVKYNNLKRGFDASDTARANPTTPPMTPPTIPHKRKASTLTKTETVKNEGESELDGDFAEWKRVKSSRAAAGKANAKIKEEYEKMQESLRDQQE